MLQLKFCWTQPFWFFPCADVVLPGFAVKLIVEPSGAMPLKESVWAPTDWPFLLTFCPNQMWALPWKTPSGVVPSMKTGDVPLAFTRPFPYDTRYAT